MPKATEDSIRSLLENDGEIISDSLASIVLALKGLYESGEGQFSREEILSDSMKIVEIAKRIRATDNLVEKMEIFFSDYQTLSNQLKTKYSDFLPSRVVRKIEAGEKYVEGLKKLIIAQEYILQAFEDKDPVKKDTKLYTGMVKLSEVLEQYILYFPEQLIKTIKNIALEVLADPTLQYEQSSISPGADYLTAIKNTARGVLWQLDSYKEEKKHTVGELLDWLETAPTWTGDDFEECLEYVNWVRE